MEDAQGLFSQYDFEYCQKATKIASSIKDLKGVNNYDKRQQIITEVQRHIQDAENSLKRLDIEARSLPQGIAKGPQQKVKEYKQDIKNLRDDFSKVQSSAQGIDYARHELGIDGFQQDEQHRERMLTSSARLQKTNDRMTEGKQMLLETEELGVGILQNLHGQREQLNTTRGSLGEADEGIMKARRVLARISRRIYQNKFLMWGIVAILIIIIIVIIISAFRRRSH